jgi:hypothetical protein
MVTSLPDDAVYFVAVEFQPSLFIISHVTAAGIEHCSVLCYFTFTISISISVRTIAISISPSFVQLCSPASVHLQADSVSVIFVHTTPSPFAATHVPSG